MTIIGALSSFTGKGRNPTAAPAPLTYRDIVLSLGPIALWGMGDDSGATITDHVGTRHATITGTVTYNEADLSADSTDGAMGFPGSATTGVNFATVPHDSGLALAALSLSFWFTPRAIPPEGDTRAQPIITKNATVATNGDFIPYQPDDAGTVFRMRVRTTGGAAIDLNTPDATLELGVTYHVCIRMDNTGYDLFIDGKYYGKNTTYTAAWTLNTQPIRFASSPTFVEDADCVLDEVALFDRVLTDSEVLKLAQQTTPPVAASLSSSVPESATTAVDVLGDSTWVGSNPTITIIAQPTGGDSVVVSGTGAAKVINYTAGAVTADTQRTFQYRITDPNGTSNTATVTVTVLNTVAPSDPTANCYTENTTDTVLVASMAELRIRIDDAPPGRTILISPGTYAGGTLTFDPSGTTANPIVVRPQGARGSVTINDPTWTLAAGSSSLVMTNLTLNRPAITINGTHHRFARNTIPIINRQSFIVRAATDLRIDHNDVSGYVSDTVQKCFVRLVATNVGNGSCQRVLVDYNYCHDINPTVGVNGSDFIGLSSSGGGAAATNPNLIIDHNLFARITLTDEGELVGAKCTGVIFRFNTMLDTGGLCYVNAPRQGDDFEARSNWFEGTRQVPLMLRSDNGLGIGNRFVGGLDFAVTAGDFYWNGVVETGYPAARNCRVIGNRMGSGHIIVGWDDFSSGGVDVAALNTNLYLNTRDSGGDAHELDPTWASGTTFNTDAEAFVAAVKLTTADVGVAAPDPLCPSGPQS